MIDPEILRRLVDRRTGIIRRVEPRPVHDHLPRSIRLMTSIIADTRRFSPWSSDATGAGCAFWNRDAAAAAAVGEAVERYSGNLVSTELATASYEELREEGRLAVDPAALALFAPAQHAQRGFPFESFTRDLRVAWVNGRDVVSGATVAVPASLVWVTYLESAPTAREPRTNPAIDGGVAAGTSWEAAEWSALLEVIERDALTLSWVGRGAIMSVVPPAWLARLGRGTRGALSTRLIRFPSEFGLPVIGALVVDEVDGYVTLGTACRAEPSEAMLKALAEAMQTQMTMRDLDDLTSTLARTAEGADSPLKPWRPRRDYLSAYRLDWRDVTQPGCQLQLYLDPVLRERLEVELEGLPAQDATGMPPPPAHPDPTAADHRRQISRLSARMARAGYPVYSVDVTTADVRSVGFFVVRVVVPGLSPNGPAAFPFLGGRRLDSLLCQTGVEPRILPLPH